MHRFIPITNQLPDHVNASRPDDTLYDSLWFATAIAPY